MPRPMHPHKRAMMRHFQARLEERYGLRIGFEAYWRVVDMVKERYAEIIEKGDRVVVPIQLPDGTIVRAVWDREHRALCTVLAKDHDLYCKNAPEPKRKVEPTGHTYSRTARLRKKRRLQELEENDHEAW